MPFAVALLFVHGIGAQRPGQTLQEFEVPLRKILRLLVPTLVVESHSYFESDGVAAHSIWELKTPSGSSRWLLSEARWADAFNPPRTRLMSRWMGKVQFWFVAFHFCASALLRLRSIGFAADDAYKRKNWRQLGILCVAFLSMPFIMMWAFVWRLILIPIILVFLRLLLAFEKVQGVKRLAGIISAFLGDSFALIADEKAESQMLERISRDYIACRNQARHTIVVAHSQGAYLAREVLQRRGDPRTRFVTLGAGVAALHALRRAEAEASYRFAIPFVVSLGGLVALAVFNGMIIIPWRNNSDPAAASLKEISECFLQHATDANVLTLCVDPDLSHTALIAGESLLQGIPVFVLLIALPLYLNKRAEKLIGKTGLLNAWKERGRDLAISTHRKRMWVDMSSPRDPVSLGGLLDECADVAVLVSNNRFLLEHVRYNTNPAVLSRIAWLAFAADSGHKADVSAILQYSEEQVRLQRRFTLRLQAVGGILSIACLFSFIWSHV